MSATWVSRYIGAVFILLTLIAAPVIDVVVLGEHRLIPSFYGVPILLAAPIWRPRAVIALAVFVIGLHTGVGFVQADPFDIWFLYTLSLTMLAALGVLLSAQRQHTERRAHEAEIARKQLQTFMSMVVHELAPPVTGILARTQLALRTASRSRERRVLAAIEKDAHSLSRLVHDLRDASQAGSGQFEVNPEPTDLAMQVMNVVDRHRRSVQDREITLDVRDDIHVACDRERMTQVISNLISNAVKYSPDGAPVSVEVWRDGDDACIGVTDRGPGIPPADRARVFMPFSRLDATQAEPGTGLGLYVSHAIVAAHGGSIRITGTGAVGSTFTVRLPGAADSSPEGGLADASPA